MSPEGERKFTESKKGLFRTGRSKRVLIRRSTRDGNPKDDLPTPEGPPPDLPEAADVEADDESEDSTNHGDDDPRTNITNNNNEKDFCLEDEDEARKSENEDEGDEYGFSQSSGFSLPPWASSIANVVKPVMGYVTTKAISLMKATLQYVPDVDISEEDEDGEFMDAEQDSDSEFEDASLQLGVRDG